MIAGQTLLYMHAIKCVVGHRLQSKRIETNVSLNSHLDDSLKVLCDLFSDFLMGAFPIC